MKETDIMDRQLVKIYIFIIVAMVVLGIFAPVILGKTSGLFQDIAVKTSLLFYGNNNTKYCFDKNKGSILFVFDNGWKTQYTKGFKTMKEYGLKASIAVIPTRVGMPGYMDYQELAGVYVDGWDLLDHTFNHLDLRSLDNKGQAEEINKGRDWLSANLFYRGRDIVVFPGSFFDDTTLEILKSNRYIAGRSLDGIWLTRMSSFMENVDICNLCSSETVERAEGLIDKAIKNRTALVFVIHKIEDISDKTEMQFEQQRFEMIVKYILDNKKQLNVLTMTEFLENYD